MRADVASQPLDPPRQPDELGHLRIGLAGVGQLGARRGGVVERDAELVGHEGHDLVHFGRGMPRARPTSRIAARAASVPNVPIWATLSAPYFRFT